MTEVQSQNPALAAMMFEANKKSVGVAYLLWFFLGFLGVHRFYAGHAGSGSAMLILFLVSLILTLALVGLAGLAILWLWWLVDVFLVPGLVRSTNTELAMKFGGSSSPT